MTIDDPSLSGLLDLALASERLPGASYRVQRQIGSGAFAVALAATRSIATSTVPVVLKVTRPHVLQEAGDLAWQIFKKECVALGRLNEQVPPTPFVVRLLDAGSVTLPTGGVQAVPWLALEYVHGGVEGDTLRKRVAFSISSSGHAFEPGRTRHMLSHLGSGLGAIHDVKVVHRDIKPTNVLCCGFGDDEVFKVSDFGISRPSGMHSTFGEVALGTPGYVAPEQIHMRVPLGPQADVFALASLVYFVITGAKYFNAKSAVDAVLLAEASERKSVRDSPKLDEGFSSDRELCDRVDALLAEATAADPRDRPRSVAALCRRLVDAIGRSTGALNAPWLIESVRSQASESADYRWTLRHQGSSDCVLYSAAWGGDGTCLAASTTGLRFYDGSIWRNVDAASTGTTLVGSVRPGVWWVAGDGGPDIWRFDEGQSSRWSSVPTYAPVRAFAGDLDDLAVVVSGRSGKFAVHGVAGGYWLKPLDCDALHVAGVVRVDADEWLLVGRGSAGAYLARVRPLEWSLKVEAINAPPLVATAAADGAIAAGGTTLVEVGKGAPRVHAPVADVSLTAVGRSPTGVSWAAGCGIALRRVSTASDFHRVATPPEFTSPAIALHAGPTEVEVVTVDGAVWHGRPAGAA